MPTTLPDILFPFSLHSTISLFWALLFTGVGLDIIFYGSRGGNDTRLHCLGTVEYLGLFYTVFYLSWSIFVSHLFTDCFLCTWDEQPASRYVVGFGCERNHPELFLFEIDILGALSRVASRLTMHSKMA